MKVEESFGVEQVQAVVSEAYQRAGCLACGLLGYPKLPTAVPEGE